MRRAIAVIGANFGDEGKGRVVDALATPDTVVVRFNGGAQAGHTVFRNGHRHVFSHFGAGTLQGAATFLSSYFVVNPVIFANEYVELRNKGVDPIVRVDRDAQITTPYEVAINRALERRRSSVGRHGSCGVGFGETVERAKAGVNLTIQHAIEPPRSFLKRIYRWAKQRCFKLNLPVGVLDEIPLVEIERWIDCYVFFLNHVIPTNGTQFLAWTKAPIIFEGAQGLLLDQRSKFFPHVTYSNTGSRNVTQLAVRSGIRTVDTVYVTRTYLTRHGAGPLPGENPDLKWADATNVDGEWQGALRFAPLDVGLLAETIKKDAAHRMPGNVCLAVNNCDQHYDHKVFQELESQICSIGYAGWGAGQDDLRNLNLTRAISLSMSTS